MKNLLYLLFIPILFLSCSDSDNEEIIKLEVDDYNVFIYLGQTSEVAISGGKGNLSYQVDNPDIAEASLSDRTIMITGKKEGYTKIVISDEADNTCELNVSVNTKSINVTTDVCVVENGTYSINLPNDGDYTITSADETIATAVIQNQTIVFSGRKAGQKTTFTLRNTKDKAEIAMIDVKVIYEIELSKYQVTVKKGETATINVLRGNGEYSIGNGTTNIATAQISGNAIQITGHYVGSVTLMIEDKEKVQRKGILVNVEL